MIIKNVSPLLNLYKKYFSSILLNVYGKYKNCRYGYAKILSFAVVTLILKIRYSYLLRVPNAVSPEKTTPPKVNKHDCFIEVIFSDENNLIITAKLHSSDIKSIKHFSGNACELTITTKDLGLTDLSFLAEFHNLKYLYLKNVSNLENIDFIQSLINLRELRILGCEKITKLDPIKHLTKLEKLELEGESKLEVFPDLGIREITLKDLGLTDLSFLAEFHNLKYLCLKNVSNLENIDFIQSLINLRDLRILGCEKITKLDPIKLLTKLEKLELDGESKLEVFSDLGKLSSIREITLKDLGLTDLSFLAEFHNLKYLCLKNVSNLENIDFIQSLINLRELRILGCEKITKLDPIKHLTKLEKLELEGESKLEVFPDLGKLSSIREITLLYFTALKDISSLGECKSLNEVNLIDCFALENVECLSDLSELKKIDFSGSDEIVKGYPIVAYDNTCHSLSATRITPRCW